MVSLAPSWLPPSPSKSPTPDTPTLPIARNSTSAWTELLPVNRTAISERFSTPTASSAISPRTSLNGKLLEKEKWFLKCELFDSFGFSFHFLQHRLVQRSSFIHPWCSYTQIQHPIQLWSRINKSTLFVQFFVSKKNVYSVERFHTIRKYTPSQITTWFGRIFLREYNLYLTTSYVIQK